MQDASLQLMRKCVTFFDNVSPCTPCFQAFLTEIALLVQLHFKAFLVKLRKARVQYLRSVPDDLFRFAVGASVHIVMSTATGQSRGARDRGRSAFELCESTVDVTQR